MRPVYLAERLTCDQSQPQETGCKISVDKVAQPFFSSKVDLLNDVIGIDSGADLAVDPKVHDLPQSSSMDGEDVGEHSCIAFLKLLFRVIVHAIPDSRTQIREAPGIIPKKDVDVVRSPDLRDQIQCH